MLDTNEASQLLKTLAQQDTEKRHADDYQDTSIIPDSVSHGCCMSVAELREWLRSLPELSEEEVYNQAWKD
jgi:hypothetical protein